MDEQLILPSYSETFNCVMHVRAAATVLEVIVDVASEFETNAPLSVVYVTTCSAVNRSSTSRHDGNDASTVSPSCPSFCHCCHQTSPRMCVSYEVIAI